MCLTVSWSPSCILYCLNTTFVCLWHTYILLFLSADVHVIWDGDLPSLETLSSAEEGKLLPPLPPNKDNFLFTVTVSDVVSYHTQQNIRTVILACHKYKCN